MNSLSSLFISNTNISHLSIFDFIFIIFFFKIREKFLDSIVGVFVFYFLGTLLHEIAHFLVALILRAKPKMPFIFPKKGLDGSIVLGRVEVTSSSWYNSFPIAIAPLGLMTIVFLLQKYYFLYFDFNFISVLFYFYLLIILIDSAIPSVQDFKVAFSGLNLLGGLIWIFIGFLFYSNRVYIFSFRSFI